MFIPLPPHVSNVIAVGKLLHFNLCDIPKYLCEIENVHYFSNYVSLRLASLTVVLFPSSGHINATGINSFKRIKDAYALIRHVFPNNPIQNNRLNCVSSTSSGRITSLNSDVSFQIDLKLWRNRAKSHHGLYSITIKRGTFSSILIRNLHHTGKWSGCIQVFHTGTYNIMGCKTSFALRRAVGTLRHLLNCEECETLCSCMPQFSAQR